MVQKLASLANWAEARLVIEVVVSCPSDFGRVARELGIKPGTIGLIEQQLNAALQANQQLWR
ncbi:hypothetical protein ACU6RQ_00755 [Zobellella denitrificans]